MFAPRKMDNISRRACGFCLTQQSGRPILTGGICGKAFEMGYIIAQPCIGVKDTSCVDVCPVDCIHPKKDEADFAAAEQLYIDPETCIDCNLRG